MEDKEKILSNVDKVLRTINPNNKKSIVNLQEDKYFRGLVESIKSYITDYENKEEFPKEVYDKVQELLDYCTKQFEESTSQIEKLIRQREENIQTANMINEVYKTIEKKENWKEKIDLLVPRMDQEFIEKLSSYCRAKNRELEKHIETDKYVKTIINNLESNVHIEIDLNRIEDRCKAISMINVEISDVIKDIPKPKEEIQNLAEELDMVQMIEEQLGTAEVAVEEIEEYVPEANKYEEETRFEVKDSIWTRIKNSKLLRKIKAIMNIQIKLTTTKLITDGSEDKEKETLNI